MFKSYSDLCLLIQQKAKGIRLHGKKAIFVYTGKMSYKKVRAFDSNIPLKNMRRDSNIRIPVWKGMRVHLVKGAVNI